MADEESTGKLNFSVAPFVEEFFNDQKKKGIPKAQAAAIIIKSWVKYFGNDVGYKETQEEVKPSVLLNHLKDEMVEKGLTGERLEAVEKALGVINRELKNSAKEGDAPP